MIWEQRKGTMRGLRILQVGSLTLQEIGPVTVILEDRLSFNPSGYYVVKCPRCIDA